MGATHFSGPVYSTNGFVTPVTASVTAATLTLTAPEYANHIIPLNLATGQAVTLPAATGTGNAYTLFIGTTITSNTTTIKVANSTDVMAGVALVANDTDASASLFETASTSDTITFNGSTTGGIKGCMVELVDVMSGVWFVRITGAATGSEATPFSATV